MRYDYTLVADEPRKLAVAHLPSCVEVSRAREAGVPCLTMVNCGKPITEMDEADVEIHSCVARRDPA